MTGPVKRSYRASLRKDQADRTHRQMVAAAAEVFGVKGYANTRMEDVALKAGVALPTVYKAFRTKTALLLAALRLVMADEDSELPIEEQSWWRQQISTADARLQLRLIARNARNIYERAGSLLEAVRSAAAEDEGVAAVWRVINDERLQRSRLTAASLEAKAVLKRGLGPSQVATTLWLLSAPEVFTLCLNGQSAGSVEEYEAWLARTLVNALLEYAGPALNEDDLAGTRRWGENQK